MHVIINILFYCKLRRIYGLEWITTSKPSWRPSGREWKICSNMKVAKWVEAPTGTFIKQSAKTGKITANAVVCAGATLTSAAFDQRTARVCFGFEPRWSDNPCVCMWVRVCARARVSVCFCFHVTHSLTHQRPPPHRRHHHLLHLLLPPFRLLLTSFPPPPTTAQPRQYFSVFLWQMSPCYRRQLVLSARWISLLSSVNAIVTFQRLQPPPPSSPPPPLAPYFFCHTGKLFIFKKKQKQANRWTPAVCYDAVQCRTCDSAVRAA